MRCRDGRERGDLEFRRWVRTQPRDQVARVQAAHAVCDDVDFAASRVPAAGSRILPVPYSLCPLRRQFVEDLGVQRLCALVDGSRRRHRRRDALDAVRLERVLDPRQ